MRETPFVEHREGDGAHCTGGGAGFDMIEQPLLESLRLGIFACRLFEQLAPQGQAYGIGGLVALASAAAAVGCAQRGQQAVADAGLSMAARADQQLAGLITWVPSGALYLVLALILVVRLIEAPQDAAGGARAGD